MGFLKDLKGTIGGAVEMSKSAQQMGAQQDAILGGAPYDANDPAFAPIEGIDCDAYARIMGQLGKGMIMGPANVKAYVESQGVKPDTWQTVQLGWTARQQQYPHVMQRIGTIMSAAG